MGDLELRILKLERSTWRWRFAAVGMMAAILIGFIGADKKQAVLPIVTAEKFALVDPEGNMRGEWKMREGAPFQILYDSKGIARIVVDGADKQPGVAVHAGIENSLPMARLTASNELAQLRFATPDGEKATIGITDQRGKKPIRGIVVNDESGNNALQFIFADGEPLIRMVDKNGHTIWDANPQRKR